MTSLLDRMLKVAGNKYASKVSEGNVADIETYIDTGSYALNALVSGSIYKGMPSNKTTAFAGESTSGKSYISLNIVRQFLKDHENGDVFYFDSESAITTEMLESRGIDIERIAILPVCTVQDFRSQAYRMLDQYIADVEADEKNRKPLLFVLDSLGALSTIKEITDVAEGSEARDMTKAQLVRGMFRVLDLKLGVAKVPMIVTNHSYSTIGCGTAEMKIRMYDGSIKSIKDIEINDDVAVGGSSEYISKIILCHDKVIQKHGPYISDQTYLITLNNGSNVRVTGDHKFMTIDGLWIKVSNLQEGDVLVCVSE